MSSRPRRGRPLALRQMLFFLPETPRHGNRPDRRSQRRLLAGVLVYVGLWAAAALKFGLPGLYLPALAKVPVMMLIVARLAWG